MPKFTIINNAGDRLTLTASDEAAARVAAMNHFHGPAPQALGLAPQSANFPNNPRGPGVVIDRWTGSGLIVLPLENDQ